LSENRIKDSPMPNPVTHRKAYLIWIRQQGRRLNDNLSLHFTKPEPQQPEIKELPIDEQIKRAHMLTMEQIWQEQDRQNKLKQENNKDQ
jgi:hypothetical protein